MAENRIYLYALSALNEEKKGVVDEAFTEIIAKVLQVIAVGMADQLLEKLSELDEQVKTNSINLINRDF